MPKFYFQIKGKLSDENKENSYFFGTPQNWGFPPIYSGMVEAESKKEAKEMIDDLYGRKFPLRVLKKDLDSNEFLLSIEEMKEGSHFERLFLKRECILCGESFYVIDKYNDHHEQYKGTEYCTDACKNKHKQMLAADWGEQNMMNGIHPPVIYKITNKKTGKCYIGKTTRPFTLRWYQHFFHHKGNKFHNEIAESHLSDWIFEVQEIVEVSEVSGKEKESLILERERFWINHYNSVEDGYNSI